MLGVNKVVANTLSGLPPLASLHSTWDRIATSLHFKPDLIAASLHSTRDRIAASQHSMCGTSQIDASLHYACLLFLLVQSCWTMSALSKTSLHFHLQELRKPHTSCCLCMLMCEAISCSVMCPEETRGHSFWRWTGSGCSKPSMRCLFWEYMTHVA